MAVPRTSAFKIAKWERRHDREHTNLYAIALAQVVPIVSHRLGDIRGEDRNG